MPKVNTHLHLALKLSEKLNITDLNSFLLGNAYSDMEKIGVSEVLSDFDLGRLFHLWIDNHILEVDMQDISKYDRLICDMEVIGPVIQELRQNTYAGREYQAMQNILVLESEPMPLYLVPEDKKRRYNEILDELVDEFVREYINQLKKPLEV